MTAGKTLQEYLDAEGAFLYYGFKQEITREEFARRIEENTLLEVLNAFVRECIGLLANRALPELIWLIILVVLFGGIATQVIW